MSSNRQTLLRTTAGRLAGLLLPLLLAPTLFAQVSLDDEPRRYLTIQVEGSNRTWDVRPHRITDRTGGNLRFGSEGDFAVRVERWERTGLPRRYDVSLWRRAFNEWLKPDAPDGSRFYFYAIEPRIPRVEQAGVVNVVDDRRRLYWVPPQRVSIVSYPMTWVDVFEAYVNQFSGEERQAAVNAWEERHRDSIRNAENSEQGFTPEERNEFARFYEQQFVYIRDRNPKLASIYDELAAFHRERYNLDAELSTYLGALRAGVESPDRERFALAVGRSFVNRLNLYAPALPYLEAARVYSEARWLLARCMIELSRHDDARRELIELVELLKGEELLLENSAESETARAWLTLAELEFSQHDFAAANAALDRIPQGSPHWDAGRVLYCAMLLHRNLPRRGNEQADHARIRESMRALSWWNEVLAYATAGPDARYPLDPLKARALLIYAQTDPQFVQDRPERPLAPRGDVLAMLDAAKRLDPLSAEPWLAQCRLYRRLGMFRDALAACESGLEIEPGHVLLNFAAADLHMKARSLNRAKDYLSRCLHSDPDFYPALVQLGEIALLDIERIRNALLVRAAAGEEVDRAGELVPPMKEAAAFFTAALAIKPQQPATELAMATLYLRLAETAPDAIAVAADAAEVRRAYLTKARDLARELINRLARYADGQKPGNPGEREIAAVPSLASYNVYAYALYALGNHDEAKQAFGDHLARAVDRRFFPTAGLQAEYQRSEALSYAREWLRRIEENQRQYFDVERFDVDSDDRGFYGSWSIVGRPKPDAGFQANTRIRDGKLQLGIQQAESGVVSRIEIDRPHSTLAAFEAEFARVGDSSWERGVFISKARQQASGSARPAPLGTVMVGLDPDNRVYWETRDFRPDNETEPEQRRSFAYIDVSEYGGVPLRAQDPLKLGIRRQLSEDGSELHFFALINGHEVRLPLESNELMARGNDLSNPDMRASCGFYATAFRGTRATAEIEQARFVFDSGLAERRR